MSAKLLICFLGGVLCGACSAQEIVPLKFSSLSEVFQGAWRDHAYRDVDEIAQQEGWSQAYRFIMTEAQESGRPREVFLVILIREQLGVPIDERFTGKLILQADDASRNTQEMALDQKMAGAFVAEVDRSEFFALPGSQQKRGPGLGGQELSLFGEERSDGAVRVTLRSLRDSVSADHLNAVLRKLALQVGVSGKL